ncbi:MAG: sodium/solute symporter [Verrucomicrobiota bacterium]
MNSLHSVDWIIIALYFGAMGYLGYYFSRKNDDTEEYFVGGRSFKGWVLGLSMVGTSISSISFLAYPADAYRTAWVRMLPNFAMPLAAIVALLVFIPFYRSGKITSAYQYLGRRYGDGIRIYGSCAYMVTQFIRLGIVLFLVGKLLETMVGWPIWTCILLAGIVVAAYTVAGGFDAVVWTDVIQTFVLVLGGIAIFIAILLHIPGGLSEIITTASTDGKLAFSELREEKLIPIGWGWALSEKTGLMMLILGLTWWLQEFASDQTVVQRYCSAASEPEARKAVWWSVCSRLPIWAFFMFLGTALYVFFKLNPSETATTMLTGEEKPEGILPYFVMNFMPPGIAGLIIAAAIAAAMSSLDSSMNAISAVFVTDIYRSKIQKNRDETHYLRVARIICCLAALVMISLATLLAYTDTKTLQDVSSMLGAVFGGGILGLFAFGFFTKWGDGRAAATGIIATLVYTIYILLGKNELVPLPPFDLYYTAIIGNLVMFITAALASLFFKRSPKHSLENLTVWTMQSS